MFQLFTNASLTASAPQSSTYPFISAIASNTTRALPLSTHLSPYASTSITANASQFSDYLYPSASVTIMANASPSSIYLSPSACACPTANTPPSYSCLSARVSPTASTRPLWVLSPLAFANHLLAVAFSTYCPSLSVLELGAGFAVGKGSCNGTSSSCTLIFSRTG